MLKPFVVEERVFFHARKTAHTSYLAGSRKGARNRKLEPSLGWGKGKKKVSELNFPNFTLFFFRYQRFGLPLRPFSFASSTTPRIGIRAVAAQPGKVRSSSVRCGIAER